MATLYLDRRNLRLKREGHAIAMYQSGERRGTMPMALLDRIVIRGSVELDTGLIGELADKGIAVLLFSGRNGRKLAIILGRSHADARRRVVQYQKHANEAWRLQWAGRLIEHKLKNQLRVLRIALQQRPDERKVLTDSVATMQQILGRLTDEQPDMDQIRGLEGAAAAAYFRAYTRLFPASLGFQGRNRRPPRDPVNACLSLVYTMLHFEAVAACHASGLDSQVGFFHELSHGRESLASDLIEPLRARADQWVWGLFRERRLRGENFTQDGSACLLGKQGRLVFYAEYESFVAPIRRLLRRYTVRMARRWVEDEQAGGPGVSQ